jgi:hypothetical protein
MIAEREEGPVPLCRQMPKYRRYFGAAVTPRISTVEAADGGAGKAVRFFRLPIATAKRNFITTVVRLAWRARKSRWEMNWRRKADLVAAQPFGGRVGISVRAFKVIDVFPPLNSLRRCTCNHATSDPISGITRRISDIVICGDVHHDGACSDEEAATREIFSHHALSATQTRRYYIQIW